MDIKIRTNGIEPDNVVAEYDLKTHGGKGGRTVTLYGAGKTEVGARQQLAEQAKAMRNELNLAIEDMIGELCAGILDGCTLDLGDDGRAQHRERVDR
jgi:hypothetical protein